MATEILKTGEVTRICLLDYDHTTLSEIFINKGISKMLHDSGNVAFQDYIDLFLESSGEEGLEENKDMNRQVWSYDLPVGIAEAIKRIAEENSQEKISDSISPSVRG